MTVKADGITYVDEQGGGGGATDVNLVEVDGAAISLGQKAMAASLPVVVASDQSPLPVTGTVSVVEPVSVDAVNLDIRNLEFANDKVDVSGSSGVGVTGTFFQATQPVSAASLPLPTGASTLAEQQTQTTALQVIDDWDESDRAKVNPIAGQAGVQGGAGATTALTQRVSIATDANVVSTKTDLSPASPTFVAVDTTSEQVVASNSSRKGLILTNTSNGRISLAFGATAVLDSGVTLFPQGAFNMGEYDFDTGAVNAIASATGCNLAIQEFS